MRARLSLAGERLPAEFSAVANALTEGTIGLDSAHAIIQGLTTLTHPVGKDVLRAAESRTGGCGDRGDRTVPGGLHGG